jgi:hypothetical protein
MYGNYTQCKYPCTAALFGGRGKAAPKGESKGWQNEYFKFKEKTNIQAQQVVNY